MSGSLLPQELVDTIIEELHDDNPSLKTCALVSSSWVPTSHRHLFRFISLTPSYHKHGTHSYLLYKFLTLLDTSPYLSRHVRSLELDPSQAGYMDIQVLFVHLQLLEEIRIVDFEETPIFPFERLPFHKLLRLPRVTRLQIGSGAWYLADVLPCLRSGGQLQEIQFTDVIFEGTDACSTTPVHLPHIQLKNLRIERGFVRLLGYLKEVPGVDLTRLRRLEVLLGVRNAQTSVRWRNRFPIAQIQDVLNNIDGTLEHLALDVFLDEPLCDLFAFTKLRSLTIHIRWYVSEPNPRLWLDWIIASLSVKRPCMMEEITLRISTYPDDTVPDLVREWKLLDERLSQAYMSRLKKVNILQDQEGAVITLPNLRRLKQRGVTVQER